jgi:hypothetical protein
MPTCRDIITRALRKVRIYGAGEEPSTEDANDALDELQNLYEQWGSGGMFGRLNDTIQTDDYEAEPFDRVTISGGTVTLPDTQPDDDEKPPYALSFIEVIDTDNDTVTRYLYDNGAWTDIAGLTLNDEAPLANYGRSGLAACLALSLAEEHGAAVGPGVMRQAGAFKTAISLKTSSEMKRTAPAWF